MMKMARESSDTRLLSKTFNMKDRFNIALLAFIRILPACRLSLP